jgi:hypothetical protein
MSGTGTTVFPAASNLTISGGGVSRLVRIDGPAGDAGGALNFNLDRK